MSGFVDGIGEFIRNAVNAGAQLVATIVHAANVIVPGGFPAFVVLCAIAVLVGLATYRR